MMQRALAGLLGLAAVLAGTISLELAGIVADDGGMIANVTRPSSARPNPAAAPLVLGDSRQAQVDDILARPLFVASRRPAAAVAGPAAAPVNLPRLAAVLVNGPSRSVIFAAAEGGRPVVAQEGAQIGAYTVQAIEAGQVTLAGPGGTRVLRPTFDARQRATANAAPVTGGPAPVAAVTDVMQSLRGLPGFSGAAR